MKPPRRCGPPSAPRAKAFGPAYKAYMAFKRVVHDDMGSSSLHYRRLQIRRTASGIEPDEQAEDVETEETAPDSGVVPSVEGASTAATGEPKPVKIA